MYTSQNKFINKLQGVKTKNMKIACLGPAGTHSEAATKNIFANAQLVLYPTISAAINALETKETDFCVVPIENSIEGSINITLDNLSTNNNFCIIQELVWPIRNHLLAKDNTTQLKTILSHPQALAQCRETLKKLYPNVQLRETSSTAEGAAIASTDSTLAAIGTVEAANLNGLIVRNHDIQDSSINCTRFVVIKASPFDHAEKNAAKTSLVCELDGEKPGILYELLKEFAQRKVNLVRIESRPARTALGRYIFFLDFEDSTDDKNVKEALNEVKKHILWLRIIGSYPVLKA